jgi:NitT/TauT family transport system ATP-binding protein
MNIFMITHDLKDGFELGTSLLVFDKVRLDLLASEHFGSTITYDIPLGVTSKKLFDEQTTTTQRTERSLVIWYRPESY